MAGTEAAPPDGSDEPNWPAVLNVEGARILCTTVLLLMVILSIVVRRSGSGSGSGNRFLHTSHAILSTVCISSITYVMDSLAYSDTPSPIFVVSTALLEAVLIKTMPNKAFKAAIRKVNKDKSDDDGDEESSSLSDPDNSPIAQLATIVWLIFLLFNYNNVSSKDIHSIRKQLSIPACFLLVLSFIKVLLNIVASAAAARSFRVGKNAEVVVAYMNMMKELEQSGDGDQGNCFETGCRYLVGGEEKQTMELSIPTEYTFKITSEEDLITVKKVWTCQGSLLKENERNRDVCLSFSLSKLLRLTSKEQRSVAKANYRSLDLVLNGPFKEPTRAFRIVDRELAFIDDNLRSPLPFTYFSWFAVFNILLSSLFFACCLYIGYHVLHRVIQPDSYLHHVYLQSKSIDRSSDHALMYVEVVVCLLILLAAILLEILEVGSYIFSDQARVQLLCKYVKNQNTRPFVGKVIECLYPNPCIPRLSKKLGQYSLLGNKKESPIKLSSEVKEAIIASLSKIITTSSSCSEVLNELGIPRDLLKYDVKEYGYVGRILVWHIATTRCKGGNHGFWRRCVGNQARASLYFNSDHMVASSLSRYCTYLVGYAPELVPDKIAWTRFILEGVKDHMKKKSLLNKLRSCEVCKPSKVKILLPGAVHGPNDSVIQKLIDNGEKLGEHLSTRIVADEGRIWKFLAEVWAEILLSVATSNRVSAHMESIRKGGEFITHVWALLSNAGIDNSDMIGCVLAPMDSDDSI